MSLRESLAAPALGLWRLTRALVPAAQGSFRILLFHDIPQWQRQAFAVLVGGLAERNLLITPGKWRKPSWRPWEPRRCFSSALV